MSTSKCRPATESLNTNNKVPRHRSAGSLLLEGVSLQRNLGTKGVPLFAVGSLQRFPYRGFPYKGGGGSLEREGFLIWIRGSFRERVSLLRTGEAL